VVVGFYCHRRDGGEGLMCSNRRKSPDGRTGGRRGKTRYRLDLRRLELFGSQRCSQYVDWKSLCRWKGRGPTGGGREDGVSH
jgi:hypothetical protein